MITVSANRCGAFAQCPASAAYWYIANDPTARVNPYVARAQRRGQAIHAAVFGEVEDRGGARGGAVGPGPFSGGHRLPVVGAGGGKGDREPAWWDYPSALAQVDAALIWTFMEGLWPGAVWRSELELTAQLTPSIRLEGRLDALGRLNETTWILPDLKSSTRFTTPQTDGQCDDLDMQLLLYAHLVRVNLSSGMIPSIWRVGFNPTTKRIHRRQYQASDQLLAQACRYAVFVACSLERMHMQHPLEWHRSMQCSTPFPCKYKAKCARDCGAWYTTGAHGEPEVDPSADPNMDPTSGNVGDDPLGGLSLESIADSLTRVED